MGYCDEILRAKTDDEHRTFIKNFQDAKDDVVSFVNERMSWDGEGKYHRWLKGSFNIGYVVKRPEGGSAGDGGLNSVFIRFSMPGRTYSPWRTEKVENEVAVVEYLREHTTIPLPRVHSWGTAEQSPRRLAPFILMEFVNGACLDDLIKKPTESVQDPLILDPDIDPEKLRPIYRQIASYMLQLSQLRFPRIGAPSRDPVSGRWDVVRRPLTYDMNDLASDTGFPPEALPAGPLNRTAEFFEQRADELWTHLRTQQNICETREEARRRFVARRRLRELIPRYTTDDDGGGNFMLFGDDFGPFNMLADPATLQITAVLDLEFTNAMPAQYLCDMPAWLLLASPHCWLEDDDKAGFEALFLPQMELFIKEVEGVEEDMGKDGSNETHLSLPLSVRMRESWRSGRFWFNYAMRTSIDADVVYWKALDDGTAIEEFAGEEMEEFVEMKMQQYDAYLKDTKNEP